MAGMGRYPQFSAVDYVVFFLTIAISISIGVFFAIYDRLKKKNTPEQYFLAGRKLKILPTAISFVVTYQSSILFIGVPAEVYAYGMYSIFYTVGFALATVVAAIVIIPVFHPLKLMSVYQYFYIRYGNRYLEYFTLTLGVIFTIFYMGTVIYAACVSLYVVIGMPIWATIIIYTLSTTVYTAIGGIKAVVWTDVFQFVVMVSGIAAVLVKITVDIGGAGKVFELGKSRFESLEVGLDPRIRYTVWNTSFCPFSAFFFLSCMQSATQRFSSTSSTKKARNMYFLSICGCSLNLILASMMGAFIFAYNAWKECDVFSSGIIKNINGIVPYTVLELFQNQPGLVGLFIAALSSGALSTLSSCLSGLSAVTYVDVIKVKFPNIREKTATMLSKGLVIAYGLLAMGMAFVCSVLPGSIVAAFQSFVACLDGPTSALFLLSVMYRRSTTKGLLVGATFGAALPLWLNLGRRFSNIPADPMLPGGPTEGCYNMTVVVGNLNETIKTYLSDVTSMSPMLHQTSASNTSSIYSQSPLDEFYKISFMNWSMLAFLVTLAVGIVVSRITSSPKVIDERCIFSFKRHLINELFKGEPNDSTEDANEDTKMLDMDT